VRVGIVGGTFDPIHLGHTALAEWAARCAGLDKVLLVPAGQPPHRGGATAPAADRLEMCLLAAAERPRLEVSDVELRRPGPSYTVDTLQELTREQPEAELFLVLGWDAARELRSWREPDTVLRLAKLVIVSRPGFPEPTPEDVRRAGIDPACVVLCGVGTPEVEATDIRRLLETGGALDGMVDPAVEAYLRRRGLYGAQHDGRG
jgi:nicotinate-nucleotide adenylyltransferase